MGLAAMIKDRPCSLLGGFKVFCLLANIGLGVELFACLC
jgi:hypothetical protein